jgi:L-arabinose transport system substrate-binding protein
MKKIKVWMIVLAALLVLGMASAVLFYFQYNSKPGARNLKIAYICKQLSNSWFQQVTAGLSKGCKEYGVDYIAYDANYNDQTCLEAVSDAIKWGADGIAICTTNQALGPQIADECHNAGIPIVTIDDTMKDSRGKTLPHIGMATKELGTMGGTVLAKMANERGFFNKGNVVKVLQLDVPHLSVIGERLVGYREALMAQTPLTGIDFIVKAGPTGMLAENLPIARDVIKAHPEVTHWIIAGCNDESALAPLYVLRDLGFDMNHVIASGLGGSSWDLVIKEFTNGNANYVTIAAQPDIEGERAAELLYNNIVNGTELTDLTVFGGKVITVDNYRLYSQDKATK